MSNGTINAYDYIYAQAQDTPTEKIAVGLCNIFNKIMDKHEANVLSLLSIKNASSDVLDAWGEYLKESRIYTIKLPYDLSLIHI